MTVHRHDSFMLDGDRYAFDFKTCTYAKGWAQVDSRSDASYYGHWANPRERKIVGYAEGDVTVRTCDTDAEFVNELRELCRFLEESSGLGKIDPGFSADMKADFERLGCDDLLH